MTKRISRARAILQQHDALAQRRYVGETAASDELLDLARAIKKAALTPQQAEIIKLRYVDGWETPQLVNHFGSTKQAVQQAESSAFDKLDSVFERWEALENRSSAAKKFDILIAMKQKGVA